MEINMNEECLICDAPLEYLETDILMEDRAAVSVTHLYQFLPQLIL